MTVKLADGWITSDQTGRLLRVSTRGNQYICVFYIYDANFIKGITIKSRHRSDLLGAYESVYKWCESCGFKPTLHRMDNETSKDVEEFIEEQNSDVQCTAPDRHCALRARGASGAHDKVMLQVHHCLPPPRISVRLLVPALGASQPERKYCAPILAKPQAFRLGRDGGGVPLRRDANCAARISNANASQARQPHDLRIKCQEGVVSWTLSQPFLVVSGNTTIDQG